MATTRDFLDISQDHILFSRLRDFMPPVSILTRVVYFILGSPEFEKTLKLTQNSIK